MQRAMSASLGTLPDTSDIAREPNSAAGGAPPVVDGPVQPMSKNQQKKLAKKERYSAPFLTAWQGPGGACKTRLGCSEGILDPEPSPTALFNISDST